MLRVNQVARRLGIAPRTVRKWAVEGILKGYKCGPRLWFFDESDLASPMTPDHSRASNG
jgi:excisionase family DNA binding protein